MNYHTSLTHAKGAIAMLASLAIFQAGTAAAEPVSLTIHDSYSKVSGDLIEYKDGIYIVRTAFGNLQIKASTVDCEGPGCPVSNISPKV